MVLVCMRIRLHRGGFQESIATMTEISPTLNAIKDFMGVEDVEISKYGIDGFDRREPWNAPIFIVRGTSEKNYLANAVAFIDQLPIDYPHKQV